ncbi:hypothetical protein [Nocardia sp. alder85J]|uniref:hypothetical protein n=1 Tax=Nocardia sp. alder85J TaxID=2862949 RepID=UPI00225AED39|nr:hypothetical protein [Nocardia sp. alder85J]MCX4097001.1 hypothetical protein [Nocardia sp. alder85J]
MLVFVNDSIHSTGGYSPYLDSFDAHRVVVAALVARHGPDAVTDTPVTLWADPHLWEIAAPRRAADPVAGLQASRDLFAAARRLLTEYARAARAAGRCWDDLGAALNLTGGDHGLGWAAFDYIAAPAEPFASRSVSWRCDMCGRRVTDREPWTADPDDNEHGHSPDCGRHNTEVATYLEQERAYGGDTDPDDWDSPGTDDD